MGGATFKDLTLKGNWEVTSRGRETDFKQILCSRKLQLATSEEGKRQNKQTQVR